MPFASVRTVRRGQETGRSGPTAGAITGIMFCEVALVIA